MGASGSSWCCKHQVAPPELFRAMPSFFQFSLKDWGMKSETPKGWGVSKKQATSRWLDLENVSSNIQNKIRVWGGRYLCVHWASSFISLHLTFLNTVWEQRGQQVPQIHLTPSLLSPKHYGYRHAVPDFLLGAGFWTQVLMLTLSAFYPLSHPHGPLRFPLLLPLFSITLDILAKAIKQEK